MLTAGLNSELELIDVETIVEALQHLIDTRRSALQQVFWIPGIGFLRSGPMVNSEQPDFFSRAIARTAVFLP